MLLNYFFVCSGFFGIVNLIVFTIYFKRNKAINLHLLFLLLFLSLNFILISLRDIITPINTILDSSIYNYSFVFNSTLLYLYVFNIEKNIKILSIDNCKHLISIILLILCASYFPYLYSSLALFKILLILISIFYNFITFDLIKNRIYTSRIELKLVSDENEIINNWTVFIFLLNLTNLIQIILVFDFYHVTKINYIVSNLFGALIFNVALIKISSSPEILYGYKVKNNNIKKIETFNLKFGDLWIKIPSKKITNSQDAILFENIKDKIQLYSNKIDNLIIETKILRKSDISLDEISKMLEIPKSHLTFLFKYHCKINYSEYKTSARVYDSFFLINNGFLKTNTLESLSIKVGFSSYNPYYIAFKKITGTTPQLYSKNYI